MSLLELPAEFEHTRGYSVLYVDDEQQNLTAWHFAFDGVFVTATASSTVEASRLLTEREFAVVVADQRMPNQSGVEFLEHTLKVQPEAVRILLTAYSDVEVVQAVLAAGHTYLTKPWDNDVIISIVLSSISTYHHASHLKRLSGQSETGLDATVRRVGEHVDALERSLSLGLAQVRVELDRIRTITSRNSP